MCGFPGCGSSGSAGIFERERARDEDASSTLALLDGPSTTSFLGAMSMDLVADLRLGHRLDRGNE